MSVAKKVVLLHSLSKGKRLSNGVMVALQILVLSVLVRIQVGQQRILSFSILFSMVLRMEWDKRNEGSLQPLRQEFRVRKLIFLLQSNFFSYLCILFWRMRRVRNGFADGKMGDGYEVVKR